MVDATSSGFPRHPLHISGIMVYNVAASGLATLPRQFFQALAPQKANTHLTASNVAP